MSRREHWTEEQRAADRAKTRERMRRLSADPEYRQRAYARRKAAEIARPELRAAPRRASAAYYARRRDDAEFRAKREAYQLRWLAERRLDEEFEAFIARIESDQSEP